MDICKLPLRKLMVIALVASPFLAACMPDAPDTELSWDANTHMTKNQARAGAPARVARNEPRPLGARTYVYEDKYAPKSHVPDYVNGNGDDTYRPTPRPAPYAATAYTPVASQPLAPVSGGPAPNFAWPISGRVISDFGAIANGGRNDGINIAAPTGAPIHASASGTVTYAGDQLKGYGNLVLVKHAGGYTTAYAHADRIVVQKGDVVTRGQIIGYAGQTGDVTQPQLHFEIRSNTTPVNPRAYLSNTTASAGY